MFVSVHFGLGPFGKPASPYVFNPRPFGRPFLLRSLAKITLVLNLTE
jgi:hypothetical protein